MLPTLSDCKGLKKSIKDLLIGQKVLFTDREQIITILKALNKLLNGNGWEVNEELEDKVN